MIAGYVGDYACILPYMVDLATERSICKMARTTTNQWSITKIAQDTHLLTWLEAFLMDRKAQGFSKGTLHFYQTAKEPVHGLTDAVYEPISKLIRRRIKTCHIKTK